MKLAVALFLVSRATVVVANTEVITRHGRLQLNWSTMQLSFAGLASGTGLALSVLEEQAWRNGFSYLQEKLPELYRQQNLSAGKQEVYDRSTAIFRTLNLRETVFSSQLVQVNFLTTLPQLFTLPSLSLSTANQTVSARNSSIVLRVANEYPPRATYRIEDQQGRTLFAQTMVDRTAFTKRLMGRYFRTTTPPRLAGRNPQVINVQPLVGTAGRLRVDAKVWQRAAQGNESLLNDAKIVIIFPPTH